MQRLDDQVAIVTGGARGIGLGIAQVLASEGATLVLVDSDGDSAGAAAAALVTAGATAIGLAADVRVREDVERVAARAVEQFGRIDILCANAGVYPHIPLDELTGDQWDDVMNINVRGALFAVQACLPAMIERSYGRVVLTSSITGSVVGQPGYAHYGASKAAMLGMMRSAALEVATRGITINAILPGNIATPGFADVGPEHHDAMLRAIPLGFLGEPVDVGWAVRYLASPEARYVTGQTLIIDGGQVLPESA